jgi:hypothetical protein
MSSDSIERIEVRQLLTSNVAYDVPLRIYFGEPEFRAAAGLVAATPETVSYTRELATGQAASRNRANT